MFGSRFVVDSAPSRRDAFDSTLSCCMCQTMETGPSFDDHNVILKLEKSEITTVAGATDLGDTAMPKVHDVPSGNGGTQSLNLTAWWENMGHISYMWCNTHMSTRSEHGLCAWLCPLHTGSMPTQDQTELCSCTFLQSSVVRSRILIARSTWTLSAYSHSARIRVPPSVTNTCRHSSNYTVTE